MRVRSNHLTRGSRKDSCTGILPCWTYSTLDRVSLRDGLITSRAVSQTHVWLLLGLRYGSIRYRHQCCFRCSHTSGTATIRQTSARSSPKEMWQKCLPRGTCYRRFRSVLRQKLSAVCERELLGRFATLSPLGRCYLDDRLKSYLVPFSQRSASKTLRTLVRGSRLALPDCRTLRFFIWWKNGKSRVDIDLSAVMYDADLGYVSTLAYYNLKEFGAHHSGDIVDAPKGAAEFIDIDIANCLDRKVRYVAMCLTSFTQQPYCDLPECFAGWMARQKPNSGEVFEPKTVIDRVDVASNTRMCLPAVFDLVSREVIWTDIGFATNPRFANNVHNNLRGVSLMLRALTRLRKTDLYTLFDLHIRARGERVSEVESADSIFSIERGITPFDLDASPLSLCETVAHLPMQKREKTRSSKSSV